MQSMHKPTIARTRHIIIDERQVHILPIIIQATNKVTSHKNGRCFLTTEMIGQIYQ